MTLTDSSVGNFLASPIKGINLCTLPIFCARCPTTFMKIKIVRFFVTDLTVCNHKNPNLMDKNRKRMETMHRMRAKGLELFYQKGYNATSIDDILKELSLSKGAFYHHFKSKDDFFISIIQNILTQKVYAMLVEPLTHGRSPIPAILDTLDNALETAEHNNMDCGFVLANFLNEFNKDDNEIIQYLRDILKIWEINLISLLKRGRTDGYISWTTNCEEAATFIVASYMGIRTMMVGNNAKILKYQYMQQLKAYLYACEQKEEQVY